MANEPPLDLRIGQRWQLADGRRLTIQAVDGGHVSGATTPLVVEGRPAPPAGAVAAYEGHRNDLVGATLLAPLWRVRVSVADDGLVEEISRLIRGVGTIEHRSSSSDDPTNGSVNLGLPTYTIDLAAADPDAAGSAIRDALGARLQGDLHIDAL